MSLPSELPAEASNYLAAIFAAMQDGCTCKACKILQNSAKSMIENAMPRGPRPQRK